MPTFLTLILPQGQHLEINMMRRRHSRFIQLMFPIRTWGFPHVTHTKWPGASLGGSYSHHTALALALPVRAHLYVTNFTRGAQVWSGIRVKLSLENGSKIDTRSRHIFYFSDVMLLQHDELYHHHHHHHHHLYSENCFRTSYHVDYKITREKITHNRY